MLQQVNPSEEQKIRKPGVVGVPFENFLFFYSTPLFDFSRRIVHVLNVLNSPHKQKLPRLFVLFLQFSRGDRSNKHTHTPVWACSQPQSRLPVQRALIQGRAPEYIHADIQQNRDTGSVTSLFAHVLWRGAGPVVVQCWRTPQRERREREREGGE